MYTVPWHFQHSFLHHNIVWESHDYHIPVDIFARYTALSDSFRYTGTINTNPLKHHKFGTMRWIPKESGFSEVCDVEKAGADFHYRCDPMQRNEVGPRCATPRHHERLLQPHALTPLKPRSFCKPKYRPLGSYQHFAFKKLWSLIGRCIDFMLAELVLDNCGVLKASKVMSTVRI